MWIAITIFTACYLLIASEKVNKNIVALSGAVFFMLIGFVPQTSAYTHYVDWNVIFLLIGMMIMTGIIKQTGLFEYLAIFIAKKAKGNPKRILVFLFFITAIISALLDNVTTVVMMVPISILMAVELEISPVPFVITQVLASNIGGTATLIGDPPNLMIGSAAHISFMDFIINISGFIFFSMCISVSFIYFFFRQKLVVSNEKRARIMEFKEKKLIRDKGLLIYSLIIFIIFLFLLVMQDFFHLPASTIALFAMVLLLWKSQHLSFDNLISNDVDWSSILFFIGLFIMVGALIETKFIDLISQKILAFTGGNIKMAMLSILWSSGVASAFLDNIPFVAATIPMIKDIASNLGVEQTMPLWWALSLGSCLGGNGTLVGASANIISAGICKKSNYPISFWTFTKYGAIITLINLTMSTIYLLVKHFVFLF